MKNKMFHYFLEGFYTFYLFDYTEVKCMQGMLRWIMEENKVCQAGFLNAGPFKNVITFQYSTIRGILEESEAGLIYKHYNRVIVIRIMESCTQLVFKLA